MYVEEEKRGPSSTTRKVRGSLEEVLARIKQLFGEFHPIAYGTRVDLMQHIYATDGTYEAVVWHANSAD